LAADGWFLGRSSPRQIRPVSGVCPKEKFDVPELRQVSARITAFNIRALLGVDKNSPGCTCWQSFFQHQFGLIFFPPHILRCDGGMWGNGWAGAELEVVGKISTGASTLADIFRSSSRLMS